MCAGTRGEGSRGACTQGADLKECKVERICTSAIRYRACLHYIQHCVPIITLTAGLTQDGLEDQTVAR